jgi:hypothetical protein
MLIMYRQHICIFIRGSRYALCTRRVHKWDACVDIILTGRRILSGLAALKNIPLRVICDELICCLFAQSLHVRCSLVTLFGFYPTPVSQIVTRRS